MQKQPLLILTICFILGILVQEYLELPTKYIFFSFGISIFILFFSFQKSFFFCRYQSYFVGLLFILGGISLHAFANRKIEIPMLKPKENIIFKIHKKLNSNEKNRRYEIIAKARENTFRSVLTLRKNFPELDFQKYYRANVYINRIEHPKNDYQFDYAKFQNRKGIYFQSYIAEKIEVSERDNLSFFEEINQNRFEILSKIDRTNMSSKSREFLKGIILADRTEMDSETVDDWSKTGLVHLLAISGSHIVIIFGIFFWIFIKIFPINFRKYAILISLIFIWIFAIFIGMGSSVMRSCIMITCYFMYILLQRKTDLLHTLAISAFLILIFDTYQLFDIGFQLSYAAVFSIYWLNPALLKFFPIFKKKYQTYLVNIVTITLSAQIGTLPLVLFYFHQFSWISIFANLIIIPFSEIIIIFSFLMAILVSFNINFDFLNSIYDQFILNLLKIIHWFSGFESLFNKNIPMSLFEVVLLILNLYFLRFLLFKFNLKNILRFTFIVMIFIVVRFSLNFYAQHQNEVMIHYYYKEKYFSVKEKSNTTFWIKKNTNIEKVQKYIIDPYLSSRRIKQCQIKMIPEHIQQISYKGKNYNIAEN